MNRLYIWIITLFLSHFNLGFAQTIKKIVVNKQDTISGYYLAVEPINQKISGALILLPGYGQAPKSIFWETKLHNVASVNEILVVAVAVGLKNYVDSTLLPKLNLAFKDVLSRYGVAPSRVVIGGYSAGGTVALRYAQLCYQYPKQHPIEPKGVFAVDSPVDLIDVWSYFDREISKNYSQAGVSEAKYMSKIMQAEHGTPQTNLEGYKRLTPFYKDAKEPGNEQYLHSIAVRVYHDVDINWYLKQRRRSIYDENYLNSSELINRLLLQGNDKAEFVQSDRKGYRSNGMRHPHSWSIVDEVECIQWIKRLMK